MSRWVRHVNYALVSVLVVNVIGTMAYFYLHHLAREARPTPSIAVGAQFPRFSGVDVSGSPWTSQEVGCRVIRLLDDRCVYCQKDEPSYEALIDTARAESCEVIEMAPQAGGIASNPRPGVVQIKYVDANIGSVMFPFATPHTVILDREWVVRFSRRGIFDDESIDSAVRLMESLSIVR